MGPGRGRSRKVEPGEKLGMSPKPVAPGTGGSGVEPESRQARARERRELAKSAAPERPGTAEGRAPLPSDLAGASVPFATTFSEPARSGAARRGSCSRGLTDPSAVPRRTGRQSEAQGTLETSWPEAGTRGGLAGRAPACGI